MARICHLKSVNSESHCVSIAWCFSAPIASPLPNPWMRFYLGYEISNSLPFSSSASLFVSVAPQPSLPFPHSPPLPVWRWACVSGFACGVPSTVVLINATWSLSGARTRERIVHARPSRSLKSPTLAAGECVLLVCRRCLLSSLLRHQHTGLVNNHCWPTKSQSYSSCGIINQTALTSRPIFDYILVCCSVLIYQQHCYINNRTGAP